MDSPNDCFDSYASMKQCSGERVCRVLFQTNYYTLGRCGAHKKATCPQVPEEHCDRPEYVELVITKLNLCTYVSLTCL